MARNRIRADPAGAAGPPPRHDKESELCERVAELERENTSLRHAAEQLDLVREQFSDLYDYAPVGYLTVDEKGTIHRVNLPAAALLGGSRQELVGTRLAGIVRPGEKAGFAAFLRSAFHTAVPVAVEVQLVRGKWRAEWVQFIGTPASAGRDLGHPGAQARLAVLDVSDRKRTEGALQESRTRFQAVIASMAEGVVVHDADGAIRECNTAAERILGLTAAEILGRKAIDPTWRTLREDGSPFPGEEHPAREVLRDGVARWNVPMGVQRPDGSLAWLRMNADPIRSADGKVNGAVVTFADVTAERASVDRLRASEERHRQLLDLLPEPVIVHRDFTIEYANRAAVEAVATGRREDLVGRTLWDFVSPGSAGLVRARAEALGGGENVPRAELRLRRGDGREIDVEVMEAAHRDERGLAIQAVLRDVTARHERQGQLQIASRLAALGTLAAGIAHEVNNPLAGIMASQALAVEVLGELQAKAARGELVDQPGAARELADVEEALNDGLGASIRIARLVRQLTALGSPDPRRTLVRLADVVDDTVGWLAASVHSRAHVGVEPGNAPDVRASRVQLGQVMVSLVANAASSIPEGRRGTVTIRTGKGAGGTAILEVEDDGEGIAPDVMARMFDPFFTTRAVGEGMGLGLSVSHAIVAAHGGTLTATSAVGQGSIFRVELPAVADPA